MIPRKRLSQTGRAVAAAMVWSAVIFSPLTAAHAQGARRTQGSPPVDAAVSSGMNDATNPSHELLLDLRQMHLTNCTASVQQAMTFLFEGTQAHFVAQPLGPDSDRWPAVFVVETAPLGGGHTHLSTLMIAPNCSGMYQQVIYWSQPCDALKATVFAKFTGEHVLTRDVKVSDSGPAVELYLSPAGTGCVSVKKELFR